MLDSKGPIAVQCDVQLEELRQESDGCHVTLRIPNREALFVNGMVPLRLFLVGIEDNFSPINKDRIEHIQEQMQNLSSLSTRAKVLSREPAFWTYLEQVDIVLASTETCENRAKQYIMRSCEIESRWELEQSQAAAQRYYQLVQTPFLAWLQEHAAIVQH